MGFMTEGNHNFEIRESVRWSRGALARLGKQLNGGPPLRRFSDSTNPRK